MKKIWLALALIGILSCFLASCDLPPSDGATPTTTSPTIVISAIQLYDEYEENEVAANLKYKNRNLQVEGVIIDIGEDLFGDAYVVLGRGDEYEWWGVQCTFKNKSDVVPLLTGQTITVLGTCGSYLFNVGLDQCELLSTQ